MINPQNSVVSATGWRRHLFPRRSLTSVHPLLVTLWSVTFVMVGFGAVMVMSASSVTSYLANQGFLGAGTRQLGFAAVGLALMWVISSIRPQSLIPIVPWLFFGGLFLQALVFTKLGFEVGGNQNWLRLGPLTLQPSEFLKLALILLLGVVLQRRLEKATSVGGELAPVLIPSGLVVLLILVGHDLGTASIVLLAVFGCLWFGGCSRKALLILSGLGAVLAIVLVVMSPNRLARLADLGAGSADYSGLGWQPTHGLWALASGGFTGAGLGNSKAKWSWLPAAENDYIFSIIGEELGFIGTLGVVIAYAVLGLALLRTITIARDVYAKAVVGGVFVWLYGQAVVNIAVVLRIAPVLGVPLPLISAGGTALISCLVAMGIVIAIARDGIEYREELRAQPAAPEFSAVPVGGR